MDASDAGDEPADGFDAAPVDGGLELVTDGGEAIVADGGEEISDDEVVQTAAEAAEQVIFSRYDRSEVTDLDIAVSFENGVLEVDVYVDADGDADPEQVADDAALAAQGAVDDLFDEP